MFEKEFASLRIIDCSVTCRLRMLGEEQGTRGAVSEVTVSVFFAEYLRHMSLGTDLHSKIPVYCTSCSLSCPT